MKTIFDRIDGLREMLHQTLSMLESPESWRQYSRSQNTFRCTHCDAISQWNSRNYTPLIHKFDCRWVNLVLAAKANILNISGEDRGKVNGQFEKLMELRTIG